MKELIERAVAIKARVVSADFKEGFEREILNYGHTLGHAIELNSNFSLRHGEAVAIGMVFVAELAHSKGLLTHEEVEVHRELLKSLGLPTTYSKESWSSCIAIYCLIKKFEVSP